VRNPREALDALRALPCGARALAAFGPGDGVHLVGGAVRDLLLERTPREVDLVVEGDLDEAAARLGGAAVTRGARRTCGPARCPRSSPPRSRRTCAAAT
jgi:hypothetical protein